MQFNNPSTIGTCKPRKILLLVLQKFNQKFGRTICLHFHAITGFFNMIVKLSLSKIKIEIVNNKVTNLSKSMFTVLRKWKELLRLE